MTMAGAGARLDEDARAAGACARLSTTPPAVAVRCLLGELWWWALEVVEERWGKWWGAVRWEEER